MYGSVLHVTARLPPPSLLAASVSTLTVNLTPFVTLVTLATSATLVRLGVGTTLFQTTCVRGHYILNGEDIYMNAKLFHV